jgi:hypothetical protein
MNQPQNDLCMVCLLADVQRFLFGYYLQKLHIKVSHSNGMLVISRQKVATSQYVRGIRGTRIIYISQFNDNPTFFF